VHIGPGDNRKVKLPNVTEEEAERRWIEESLRPKGNAKPEGKQPDQATGPAPLVVPPAIVAQGTRE
jgi:hypothetical protein